MTFKKRSKPILLLIFNVLLVMGMIIFSFYSYRSKSHLLVVKNHFPWKEVEEKMVYDPLYLTSLSPILEAGDIIRSVNGFEVTGISMLKKAFQDNLNSSLLIVVSRNKQEYRYEIEPVFLLFKPEVFLLFIPLMVVALWYSFFNKKNFLLTSLFYLQVVLAVTFCHNGYLYTVQYILFTLGSGYPLYFYLISLQVYKRAQPVFLLKLFLVFCYAVVILLQIIAYINNVHSYLNRIAFLIMTLLNQGGFICFLLYLGKKLKKRKGRHGSPMVEWQLSGFLLFYIPYLFFEVLPVLFQGLNWDILASGSYSFLFLSCFFVFSLLGKVLYGPVFLRPLEDKWLYFLFNLALFLWIPVLYSKFQWQSKELIRAEEAGLILVFGSMIIFSLFLTLKKLVPVLLLRLLPNQRIYLARPHLYMYRKTREEYYWKHRFHELEQKLLSDHCSFGINHVHQFFISYKSRVARFLSINKKLQPQADADKTHWQQLLSLNQYLQNLCDRTMPVIDAPCEIEFTHFMQSIVQDFSEHPLFSSLVIKNTDEFYVVINQEEIKFILHELIKNALEALDSAENLIELSVKRNLRQLIISVIDSGTGIFLNQRDKLFSPFYTTKSNHLGLGLYISRLYAVKNHGLLRYSKADNGGSCFQLFLPEKIDQPYR